MAVTRTFQLEEERRTPQRHVLVGRDFQLAWEQTMNCVFHSLSY